MFSAKMTIRRKPGNSLHCEVFKLKRQRIGGYATDMAGAKFEWFVSGAAQPLFKGSYGDCLVFVQHKNAELVA